MKDNKKKETSNRYRNFQRLQVDELQSVIWKQLQNSSSGFNKKQIKNAIEKQNVELLRRASLYFYGRYGSYRHLVEYYATMYLMIHKTIPKNENVFNQPGFAITMNEVFNYTDKLSPEMFYEMMTIALVEGVFYGFQNRTRNTCTFQVLPYQACRSIAKYPSGNRVVEFDLSFFDRLVLKEDPKIQIVNLYPDILVNAWRERKLNSNPDKWYQIPEQFGLCLAYDDITMPVFSGIFTDLIDLDNYKELENVKSELDLVKILVQKIPPELLDDQNDTGISWEDIDDLHENIRSLLARNQNVQGLTTPFEVDVLNIQENENLKVNKLGRAEESLFNSAGISSSLGNATGNIALNHSLTNDSAVVWKFVGQFSKWIDTYINNYVSITRTYRFDFSFLPVTWYNQNDWLAEYYKSVSMGLGKLEYALTLGYKQSTMRSQLIYERDILQIDDLTTPLITSHTASQNESGAPASDDEDLTDAGITTRERGGE